MKISGCISENGNEIDGKEFEVELTGFIDFLREFEGTEIHLNGRDGNDLDLWLKVM